jgi:hypothetical protein
VKPWSQGRGVAMVGLLAAIALLLGIALHPLAVDDAFITYRYARHLAAGQGFTYNVGRPVLSTTAPLYALILAAGALAWPDLPALANGLSAVALWAAATLVFILGCREKTPWVGSLAALFLVAYPLLWLGLGLETALFLALALGALVAYRDGRLYWTAVLLALATLTRGDGLILTGVVASHCALYWLTRQGWRIASQSQAGELSGRMVLGAVGVYVVVVLPVLIWLTWRFGSPLPATLGAKGAQAELGVTGFYPHTTYLQGMGILIRALLDQSPLYALFVPAVTAGLVATWGRGRWVCLIVVWGVAHLAGYTIVGVTPYYWYYAPLVPALVCLAALGIVESVRWLAQRLPLRRGAEQAAAWGVGGLWAATLLVALGRSDWAMVQALDGPVPPPDDPVSKMLPEAKVGVYQQAGLWLRDHTPADAVVGVTEVGIIGYYAERTMVDFLGLLEPEVAQALGRGDLYWALLRYQPDYLALTAISPLYAYDLRADPWFQVAYAPLQTFSDPRFWGSPVTVYQRRVTRVPLTAQIAAGLPEGMIHLDVDFGGQIRLLGAVIGDGRGESITRPGDVLALILYWRALEPVVYDYTVFIHLLGEHDRTIAQRDAPPGLGARPTSQWTLGQVIADPYLLALPETTYVPDQAVWEVGLYDSRTGHRLPMDDGGDNVRFGAVSVLPSSTPLRLDFGSVALIGYELDRLALSPGETLRLTLRWDAPSAGARPVRVTVQLVDERGNVETQVSRRLGAAHPDEDVYLLALGADASPGAYDLEVGIADLVTAQALPLLGADGQPRHDRALLTKVRFYP